MTLSHKTISVDLGERSYKIDVGKGLLKQAGALLRPFLQGKTVFIITDETVEPLYAETTRQALQEADLQVADIVAIPEGEGSKSFLQLERLVSSLLTKGLDRHSVLIALGGGVVGDLVGFAASIALRGIDFIQIPTTLLAQVDSSVGGKTGINLLEGKNLVGSFYQPKHVLIDIDVLNTLPERHFLSGYAEMVKYGLIDDAGFFDVLDDESEAVKRLDPEFLATAIAHCCQAKARIVAEDEKEHGKRALLNLGHTFGHALEAETGYSDHLYHGEAVAIGIRQAFDFSARMGICAPEEAERVTLHLKKMGLKTNPCDMTGDWHFTADKIIQHMQKDKKVEQGEITLILARGIGKSFIQKSVSRSDILSFLSDDLHRG